MSHKAEILKGSVKRNAASGGVEFTIHCCGELLHSVHIQNFAMFQDDEERTRHISDTLKEHEQRHESELAAHRFLENFAKGDCGCE